MAIETTYSSPLHETSGVGALTFISGGYHGTVLPEDASPILWAASSNVYRLPTGRIKRFRNASLVTAATSSWPTTSDYVRTLFSYSDTQQRLVLADIAGTTNKLFTLSPTTSWAVLTERVHPFYGSGASAMGGLWSRVVGHNVCYECNVMVKMRSQGVWLASVMGGAMWNWGIYPSRDVATVTLSSGAITSDPLLDSNGDPDPTIPYGRKYAFASVNQNALPRNHVSTRSPETPFQVFTAQQALIECVQAGTITVTGTAVVGTSTKFQKQWIGMKLWVEGIGTEGYISAVADETHMTLKTVGSGTTVRFFVYDPQVTHIRLYATSNGGATFLRYQVGNQTGDTDTSLGDNVFDPTQTTTTLAGLAFTDNNNAEPGEDGASYTIEESEDYNDPPPIGQWCKEWQDRILVWGVAEEENADGNPQTLFYSNIEQTTVGVPQDSFAPFNRFTLPIGGALIGGMGILPTGLIVMSDHQDMFKITGYLQDSVITQDFNISSTLTRMPFKLGCMSPNAITETPQGLFWISSDNQLWWYDDVSFPKYVGLAIQNLLDTIEVTRKGDVKMSYHRSGQKEWISFVFSTTGSMHNNKMIILDLNNFDPNSPNFYIQNINCEGLLSHVDLQLPRRLVVGVSGGISDSDYNGSDYAIAELPVSGSMTFHAIGNDTPSIIKDLKWVRFRVNTAPSAIVGSGWQFGVNGINDDMYTFESPLVLALIPGTQSPTDSGLYTHAPNLFKIDRDKAMQGNRLQFSVTFPSTNADWELRAIGFATRNLPAR